MTGAGNRPFFCAGFEALLLEGTLNCSDRMRQILQVHMVPQLARKGIPALLKAFGSWEGITAATPNERSERTGLPLNACQAILDTEDPRLERAVRTLEDLQAKVITCQDPGYPVGLTTLPQPPAVLYYRGHHPTVETALAIVGARKATRGICQFVQKMARDLTGYGICIVSGLARGLDTAAHQGALEGGGATIGVLGCGIDRIYPAENSALAEAMLENGTILSEYPPGVPPLPQHFPARNRIISGLSQGVLVGEATRNSGSLITADFALEQGREVFALPGLPYSEWSAGTNDLLKQGAQLVTEVDDILQVLWPCRPTVAAQKATEDLAGSLSGPQKTVLDMIGPTPCHIDEITRQSGLTPMEVSATLLDLELQGGVEQLSGMRYIRRIH